MSYFALFVFKNDWIDFMIDVFFKTEFVSNQQSVIQLFVINFYLKKTAILMLIF